MRVGQKNKLTYRWARKGSRPRQSTINARNRPMCSVRSARTANRRRPRAAEPTPKPCSASRRDRKAVTPGAHAMLILDQAGWHDAKLKPPANVTLVPLPPAVRSSTQPKTSGSICDRPISPTVRSRPTPTSSTPAKTPGENFSPKPGASPRSRLATGPSSVSSSEGWYYMRSGPEHGPAP